MIPELRMRDSFQMVLRMAKRVMRRGNLGVNEVLEHYVYAAVYMVTPCPECCQYLYCARKDGRARVLFNAIRKTLINISDQSIE